MYDLFWHGVLWLAHILFVVCFIPQVFTNFNRRSTDGLSPVTIFIYFCGYLIETLYVHFLQMPLAYRVMIPFGGMVAGTMVMQRFWYLKEEQLRYRLLLSYAATIAVAFMLTVVGMNYPAFVGHICGWVGMLLWTVYQLPQTIKVFREKSVDGFNFGFVLLAGTGSLLEFIASLVRGLPLQTVLNGVRGTAYMGVFLYQFYLYGKKQ